MRTRIAPTPSGYLHLGNALSFILTAGLARRAGARLLLRIDDLDRVRFRTAYLRDIFDTLAFLGIIWDDGPKEVAQFDTGWSQVHRLDQYENALQHLRSTGKIFACSCTRTELAALGQGVAYPGNCIHKKLPLDTPGLRWRLYTGADTVVALHDLEKGPQPCILPASMAYAIVRKSDGQPAYQLTSVVDDIYFGVDLVVRGADLFDSSIFQRYLSDMLPPNAFGQTTFLHHALLEDKEGRKLSKSAGDQSIQYLRQSGVRRDALLDLLLQQTEHTSLHQSLRDAMQALWGR